MTQPLAPLPLSDGSLVRVTERPHGHKGQYRHACANDLSGTYRDHGKGLPALLQHNAGLLSSPLLIWETEVVTGAAPDVVPLPTLLANLHQHQGFWPKKLLGDQIFGAGACRAAVDLLSQGQTQLVALVPDYEKRTDRFVPADFIPLEQGLGLTCPAGVTSTHWRRDDNRDGIDFYFSPKQCRGCRFNLTAEQLAQDPSQPHCRDPKAKPNSRRCVFISFHRPYVQQALLYNKTEQFKQEIKQRP